MRYIFCTIILIISGCTVIPDNIEPIEGFDAKRYLGTWYEIARLDHSFERGLSGVTAHYSPREDSGIKVINRGFQSKTNSWSEAEGKAYFVRDRHTGFLKVSFFGPFYGSYIIFDLGKDYEYSLVTSNNKSFFWLLSRKPVIEEKIKLHILKRITELGFATDELIFVDQSKNIINSHKSSGALL